MHTAETTRVRFFMDLLMENRRPVMLVGNAGTGKTVLVGDKFASMDPDNFMITNVPFNYYTTSLMLQGVLEKPLEKKAGRNYGPPGSKRLIYFIDDMNMPMVGLLCPSLFVRLYLRFFVSDRSVVRLLVGLFLVCLCSFLCLMDCVFVSLFLIGPLLTCWLVGMFRVCLWLFLRLLDYIVSLSLIGPLLVGLFLVCLWSFQSLCVRLYHSSYLCF